MAPRNLKRTVELRASQKIIHLQEKWILAPDMPRGDNEHYIMRAVEAMMKMATETVVEALCLMGTVTKMRMIATTQTTTRMMNPERK